MREDISSWKPKGFAYVEFETEQDMQAGLAKHEEVGLIACGGSPMTSH